MTVRFFKPFLEALLIAIDTAHRLDCERKAEPNFVDPLVSFAKLVDISPASL